MTCPSRRHVRMSTFLHSKGQRGLRGRIALTIFLAGICESDHAVRKLQVIWHSGSLAANLVPVNDHYRFGTFDNEVNRELRGSARSYPPLCKADICSDQARSLARQLHAPGVCCYTRPHARYKSVLA